MQLSLSVSPANAIPISNSFSMKEFDGVLYYFNNLVPFDFHDSDDYSAQQIRIAKLFISGGATQRQLQCAFGKSRSTVQRIVRIFNEEGERGFYKQRKPRRRTAISDDKVNKASEMLSLPGRTMRSVARELGLSHSTLHENIKAGVVNVLRTEGDKDVEATERSRRDSEDREAPMGRGATDTEGRVLASLGLMEQSSPQFSQGAKSVSKGGVLAALPAVLKEGVIETANGLFELPKGYYGVNAVILFLVLMMLARVRNPEGIRYQSPGEWGHVLGFDRCPCDKTLRKKIKQITDDGDAVERWQASLARRWMEEDPEAAATLCVDGHVKVYSGGGKLGKHFVSRQKLCLPSVVSYWVNALGGKPFLCVHKKLDYGMVKAIEGDVVGELGSLGVLDGAVDITGEDRSVEPVITMVFDREGWSPDLFRRLARRGIACITWHKNFKGKDWPEEEFEKVSVAVYGPAQNRSSEVRLAEKSISLKNGLEVRQIRRLLDNGRQVPLVTTHPSMSTEEVAGAMFSRWSQENYFKYMREQFDLDGLLVRGLEPLDPEIMVVNPRHRESQGRLKKMKSRLGGMRLKFGRLKNAEKKAQLSEEIEELSAQVEKFSEEAGGIAPKIRVGDMSEDERLCALPDKERLFIDIIRMVAYRAETAMMPAVIGSQGKKANARVLLRTLFACEADILPDHEKKILRVRFIGLGSDSCESHLENLVDELNSTNTIFPGTDLTMVYELPSKS